MNSARNESDTEVETTITFAEHTVFKTIVAIMLLTLAAAGLYSYGSVTAPAVAWLVTLAIGVASMLVGGLIGLLFAVPRRAGDVDRPPRNSNDTARGSDYAGNDNLVKVSDWLTAALTGIALATASDLARTLWKVSVLVLPDYPALVAACVIGGFASGFLLAYLRLRAKLQYIFAVGEHRANALRHDHGRIDENANLTAAMLTATQRSLHMSEEQLALPPSSKVLAIRQQQRENWQADPHKGKFGSSPRLGSLQLCVAHWEQAPSGLLTVDLELRSLQRSEELTHATFYLHESFLQPVVSKSADPDGVVRLRIALLEAFTIGVIAEPGARRLELDLAEVKEIPEEYRSAI